jgi:Rieske 2Fe-2S family protein
MSAELNDDPTAGGFNGLKRLERTLPSSWYYDPAHYERELANIWYRNWIYLCRAATLPEPRCYRTFTLGSQPLLVVRDEHGALKAFFNTCRHRGSTLCREPEGRLPTAAITCPYHAWSYRLDGELARIPSLGRPHHVKPGEASLYAVPVRVWRGFVYVNLGDPARGLSDNFNANAEQFVNWPLEDLVLGRQRVTRLRCNWKVFWENYNECLHCPGVHPNLSSLVPIYKRGIMEARDDPNWQAHATSDDPFYKGGLRQGAVTWSVDGRSLGHEFPRLSAEERRVGYHYMTSLPSHYMVLHVDHVRSTRLLPLGPEETELTLEWLFPKETLADPGIDLDRVCSFSAEVLDEDGAACELVQRGLHAVPHERGFLMPEEYDVYRFQQWVRGALDPA